MIDLPTVALFIADTRDHQLAVNTILHCKKEITFGQTIFLTDKVGYLEGIDLFTIQPIMSKDDYSNIILFNLLNKIKKDITHILIVQTDGYIVNPKSWRQEFLDYDYIGAPWKYHPNNNEPPFPRSTPENCVGNGGFNLRSVKLIQKVEELLSKNKYEKITPEDLFICRVLRKELEAQGIKFAPEELAHKFSVENGHYVKQFGFHGHITHAINKHLIPTL